MTQETIITILSIISVMLAAGYLWWGLKKKYSICIKPHDLIDGDLIIDTKDPHKDVLRFELYYDPGVLLNESCKKEFVRFRIVRNNKKEI